MTTYSVSGIAMAVQQGVSFLRAEESLVDAVAGERGAEGYQATGEELRVARDVGMGLQEGGRGEAAQAVEPGEDLVEYDG